MPAFTEGGHSSLSDPRRTLALLLVVKLLHDQSATPPDGQHLRAYDSPASDRGGASSWGGYGRQDSW